MVLSLVLACLGAIYIAYRIQPKVIEAKKDDRLELPPVDFTSDIQRKLDEEVLRQSEEKYE